MRMLPNLGLRTSVVLLQIGAIVVTLAVVGTALLAYVITEFSRDNIRFAGRASEIMATRVEAYLEDVTTHVKLVGEFYKSRTIEELPAFFELARASHLNAIIIVGPDSEVKHASLAGGNAKRERELQGVDMSAYPVLQQARASSLPVWSDKHLSAITGNVTVGLAVPLENGEVIIAEISPSSIVQVSNILREKGHLDYWIIDSKGETVADTSGDDTQIINLSGLAIVKAGFAGTLQPQKMNFRGHDYHVSATYSAKLGWLFVGRIPAGLANPDLRDILFPVLAFALGTAFFGFLLAIVWARQIAKPVSGVADLASQIAAGMRPANWPHGAIKEINALSDHLRVMSDAIIRREEELRNLNEGLEARVEERTTELIRINSDLKSALTDVQHARDELIQSEKVAALGRMVAGISHELNTPLGNGRMAVSTLAVRLEGFRDRMTDPVDVTDLNKFLEIVDMSVEIAENNLVRAGNLVRSFKEISADRTSSRRRKVVLKELFDEVCLTLTPTLKRSPATLIIDVPNTIWIDSYPGELGQAISNLIENAVVHAFHGKSAGMIAITAEQASEDTVAIHVSDDGTGMSPEVALKAFDPFFTTALGQGGTGLGLFIVHRTVETVLGGSVSLKSKIGKGTAFKILVPMVAPDANGLEIGGNMRVG